MPEDELPFAADLVDHRRRITGLVGREGLPDFLAGVLVEGDRDRALAADQADEAIAVEERMAGEAPHRNGEIILLEQVLRPEHGPLVSIVTVEMPHGAERVDLAAGDKGRGARAGGVADLIGAIVFVLPDDLAVGFVQAEDAFDTVE